jgi:glycine oxidase
VQILVIGAGIIGVAIAEELAVRGAEVTVIDMRAPGKGASWASAGLLAPYTEAERDSPLLAMSVRSLSMFDTFIERVRTRSGRAIEYARPGTLEVALDANEAQQLKSDLLWLSGTGIDADWYEPADLRAIEPAVASEAFGALHIKPHGFVGVQSLIAALTHSARAAGAVFESPVSADAVDVTTGDARPVVSAGGRVYSCDHVVVAAGSWTSRVRVKGQAPLPVRPVRGQLLHLKWSGATKVTHPVWTSGCYTVPWSDGTMLVGATVEEVGFDESTTADGLRALTTAAIRALPGIASAALLDARSGLRPASPDGLPFIGAYSSAPAVTYATGHFRNGILLAPLTAVMVASSILDGRADTMSKWTEVGRDPDGAAQSGRVPNGTAAGERTR